MTALNVAVKSAETPQRVQPHGVLHLFQVLLGVDLLTDSQDNWQEMARDRRLLDACVDVTHLCAHMCVCVCVCAHGGGGRGRGGRRALSRGVARCVRNDSLVAECREVFRPWSGLVFEDVAKMRMSRSL